MRSLIILVSSVGLAFAAFAASAADTTFMTQLAHAGHTEVQAGNVAASRGASEAVRDFGAMMVRDHGAANEKLAALAKSKGVTLPEGPTVSQSKELATLQTKSGTAFDQAYLASQLKGHQDAVQLLKTEIATGTDAETKALAQELLPTVEGHLSEVQQLAGQAPDTQAQN